MKKRSGQNHQVSSSKIVEIIKYHQAKWSKSSIYGEKEVSIPHSKLSRIKAHKLLGETGKTRSANEIFYDKCMKRVRSPRILQLRQRHVQILSVSDELLIVAVKIRKHPACSNQVRVWTKVRSDYALKTVQYNYLVQLPATFTILL
ncbi:unnamed protein product [Onchocerca flexuosa]|uniref:HTH_Tnp_Tc3_2 domain-containing protein n=1 Tax=Onchocerca flexuosa TaxID=387005 RepID=A0A183HDY0_9BILA|nr:unnamed protein product [Onchocerca flexuosa]